MTAEPRTAAGRTLRTTLLYHNSECTALDDFDVVTGNILAIEAEARSAAVWEAAEATPGFNEAMEEGLADIAAGRTVPLREVADPCAPLRAALRLILSEAEALGSFQFIRATARAALAANPPSEEK